MNTEILGTHAITIDSVIIDNVTSAMYNVTDISFTGIIQKQMVSIGEGQSILMSFDELENKFNSGAISIQGYLKEDAKILHLVLNEFKRTLQKPVETLKQYTGEEVKEIRKKVNTYKIM